jgi:hypothetical protein
MHVHLTGTSVTSFPVDVNRSISPSCSHARSASFSTRDFNIDLQQLGGIVTF